MLKHAPLLDLYTVFLWFLHSAFVGNFNLSAK